jgi:hypothetical protein
MGLALICYFFIFGISFWLGGDGNFGRSRGLLVMWLSTE